MRKILVGLGGLAGLACMAASPAYAQPGPPGSYRQQCTDIRVTGQFLSATCRGARGGGQSSINMASCAGDIGVDATGALSCRGPGPGVSPGYPGYPGAVPSQPGYRPPIYGRDAVTVYSGRNWRGRSAQFDGDIANLSRTGLNDRVRSIRLQRRSGPWLVCSDANFKGRCTRIDGDIRDTRQIGMNRAISSLRRAYSELAISSSNSRSRRQSLTSWPYGVVLRGAAP
jgi:hypothetical protein